MKKKENKYVNELIDLNLNITNFANELEVTEHNVGQPLGSSDLDLLKSTQFKDSFSKVIPYFTNVHLQWKWDGEDYIEGNCEIPDIKVICSDWNLYDDSMDDEPDFEPLKYFKIVDCLSENYAVGIYSGPYATNSLYFYEYDGVPRYLGLDLTGYIKMLKYVRWFEAWPLILISKITGYDSGALDKFTEYFPMIFNDISVDEVFAKYEELFIDEEMPPGASGGY
jgi:hypothetical protein